MPGILASSFMNIKRKFGLVVPLFSTREPRLRARANLSGSGQEELPTSAERGGERNNSHIIASVYSKFIPTRSVGLASRDVTVHSRNRLNRYRWVPARARAPLRG